MISDNNVHDKLALQKYIIHILCMRVLLLTWLCWLEGFQSPIEFVSPHFTMENNNNKNDDEKIPFILLYNNVTFFLLSIYTFFCIGVQYEYFYTPEKKKVGCRFIDGPSNFDEVHV